MVIIIQAVFNIYRKRTSQDFVNANVKKGNLIYISFSIVSLNPKVIADQPQKTRQYFDSEEHPFVMDAMDCGNIGRFLNHSW